MTTPRWRRARQIIQIISTAFFFLLAFLTYRGFESLIPLDLYFRLDPLAAFGAMIASRTFIVVLLLALAAVVFGFVFGRAWCGWLCPLGALLDWISPRTWRVQAHKNWRGIKYVLLLVIFFATLLGNLSLMILDPITLLNRTFSSAFVPALNVVVVSVETALYPIAPPLQPLFDGIEQHWRGTILPAQQTFYQLGWILALVFVGVVALNWVAPRFWCRYLCPLGAVYALQSKISWLRPRAVKDCSHCAACMRVCPTNAIAVTKDGFTVDAAECVVCMDCVKECPESAIEFQFGRRSSIVGQSERTSVDLSRRHFIGSALASIGTIALFRTAPSASRDDPWLIRPPGAREDNFLDKCIRCAECTRVCPTGGLQPSLLESGLEGFWSPILYTRLGYCDYSCNACGQVCPTGAIPLLTLEEKRQRVIGTAYIDQNRCIPWASYHPCVVCEEMCPVPDKAIKLVPVDLVSPDGKLVHVQLPRVFADICIGCGICEYKCPLSASAAIRVYAPMSLPPLT
jgi:polyferredoxin